MRFSLSAENLIDIRYILYSYQTSSITLLTVVRYYLYFGPYITITMAQDFVLKT